MLTVPHITCEPVSEARRPDHFSVENCDSSGEKPSPRARGWGRTLGSRRPGVCPATSCPPHHGAKAGPSEEAGPHPGGTLPLALFHALGGWVPGPASVVPCGWRPVSGRTEAAHVCWPPRSWQSMDGASRASSVHPHSSLSSTPWVFVLPALLCLSLPSGTSSRHPQERASLLAAVGTVSLSRLWQRGTGSHCS